jgi:PTH1 family peptidyl-tRNA hydrolase
VVAEELARRWDLSKPKDRFKGRIAEGRASAAPGASPGEQTSARAPRVAVLCPQTYMNDAGRSVGPARGSYKLPIERVLVLHDEIDLPFGEIRVRQGGGLAGHNGLKSLRRELGGPDFWRVRIGVGRPDSTDPEIVASYVLSRFAEGKEEVSALVQRAADAAEAVLLGEAQQ